MKILVINSGSSSLKYKLFEQINKAGHDSPPLLCLSEGLIDRIGLIFSKAKNHEEALNIAFKNLLKEKAIKDLTEIGCVGHRVVHGGEKYIRPTKIDRKVIKEIEKFSSLAPLHNPANLKGIKACSKLLKKIPQIAIFDTAFHGTMPEKAFLYSIPRRFYEKNKVRRYGFHGTSHKYVAHKAMELCKKLKSPAQKIITCHLGNGSSITAIKNGKTIDTSMGFTPLEGIPMGTRSGTIDPGIIFHLIKNGKFTPQKLEKLLQEESGLKALSGISSDMRKIYAAAKKNSKKALFTIEKLSYEIAKKIGGYTAALSGLDALIFTGGLGEKAFYVRKSVCEYLQFLNLKLDDKKNFSASNEKNPTLISSTKSKIKVFVIPTDEELQIAQESMAFILRL
ncbi:acetate kinase [Candidatus Peregrinibacteria bacterium]|nr:acetate kinase [Candidatus Peregrinibacteria bacterium]